VLGLHPFRQMELVLFAATSSPKVGAAHTPSWRARHGAILGA